jgi:hypothetical protein
MPILAIARARIIAREMAAPVGGGVPGVGKGGMRRFVTSLRSRRRWCRNGAGSVVSSRDKRGNPACYKIVALMLV